MGKGIGKTDLHVPSRVSAPARWLPGVDSLQPQPQMGGGTSGQER